MAEIDLKKEIAKLERRVTFTKGSRLKANSRLENVDKSVNGIMFLHTFFIVVLTLITINSTSESLIVTSDFLLIYSIMTTFISLYINAQNYKERALRFEHNYRSLEKLENKLRFCSNFEELEKCVREFESLIDDKENHKTIDYERFSDLIKSKEKIAPYKKVTSVKLKYWFVMALKYIFLIGYPFILLFLIFEF